MNRFYKVSYHWGEKSLERYCYKHDCITIYPFSQSGPKPCRKCKIMSLVFTRRGVRYKFYRSYPHRYGNGRIHILRYLKLEKRWEFLCNNPPNHGRDIKQEEAWASQMNERCIVCYGKGVL